MSRIQLYRPSNGTEGEIFQARFCYRCRKYNRDCSIVSNAFFFQVEEPAYPREWRYVDGTPTCTAFVDATIPVIRSHKPGRTQLPLFDDGTDWTRIAIVADVIDETDHDKAEKIRELMRLRNPKAETMARKAKPEFFEDATP